MTRNPLVILLAFWVGNATALAGENWPQWRGPAGSGVSVEKGFPQEWGPNHNVLWKTAIPGRGFSSPVVWEDMIFLTSWIEGEIVPGAQAYKHVQPNGEEYLHPDSVGADREHTLLVLAIDRNSGRIVWQREAYRGTVLDNRHRRNTYASGTPVTDGKRVYAFFESEGLYSYDFEGNLVWKTSLGDIPKGGMGPGMSPVLFRDLVILQNDQEWGKGSFITALNKENGETVWRTERSHRRSWATPLVLEHQGAWTLVASGAESVVGYDPASGTEIWRAPGVVSHPIPSAVAGLGRVFATAGSQSKYVVAIQLGGSGRLEGPPWIPWTYEKGTAYVPSPIFFDETLYLMTDTGIITALDGKSGEVVYEGGRVPVAARFKASPVAFEGLILLSSEDGDMFVVRAGDEFEVIRTNSVGEPIFASPALSGGQIFIRGDQHLFCIGRTEPSSE